MDTNLSIHHALIDRSKAMNWPNMSSILIINKDIPLFEEEYGWLDYDWQLKATAKYKCKEIEPSVIRSSRNDNLSLNPLYRLTDFNVALTYVSPIGKQRLCASRARYLYKMELYKESREIMMEANLTTKNVLYYITSYCPPLARLICRMFRVF